jgi:hypothetical protein
MNRWLIGILGACILGGMVPTPGSATAQDGCGGVTQGVDLAVQGARLRQRDEGWVVLYTIVNRGKMTSTSYHVSLVMDGESVGETDDYDVGLEPGHRRRWELALPKDDPSPDGHEIAVHVVTADNGSAAGPSYTDQCDANDLMPASQPSPPVQGSPFLKNRLT